MWRHIEKGLVVWVCISGTADLACTPHSTRCVRCMAHQSAWLRLPSAAGTGMARHVDGSVCGC